MEWDFCNWKYDIFLSICALSLTLFFCSLVYFVLMSFNFYFWFGLRHYPYYCLCTFIVWLSYELILPVNTFTIILIHNQTTIIYEVWDSIKCHFDVHNCIYDHIFDREWESDLDSKTYHKNKEVGLTQKAMMLSA